MKAPETYDDFRELAARTDLTSVEKIGFPDGLRRGREREILRDFLRKLPALRGTGKRILDLGCGCSALARRLVDYCATRKHELVLVDSCEQLAALGASPGAIQIAGRFPDLPNLFSEYAESFDAIIVYSVLQYAFPVPTALDFLTQALRLLAPGGSLLAGDIPNVEMRFRFLATPAGREFHHRYRNTTEPPRLTRVPEEKDLPDDSFVIGALAHFRARGYDAYVLPQPPALPMANRREDLLIRRPGG